MMPKGLRHVRRIHLNNVQQGSLVNLLVLQLGPHGRQAFLCFSLKLAQLLSASEHLCS